MNLDSTRRSSSILSLAAALLAVCALAFGCSKDGSDGGTTASKGSHDHDHHHPNDGHDHSHEGHHPNDGHDHTHPAHSHSAPAPEPLPDPATVAVTVNGTDITEGEVEEAFQDWVKQRTGGQPVPEATLAQARQQVRKDLLNSMIDDQLMQEQVAAAGITISREDMQAELDRSLQVQMDRFGLTREEIAERTQQNAGMSLEAYMNEQMESKTFVRMMEQTALLNQRYADDVAVSDEDVASQYEEDKDRVYTTKSEVKASHILLKTDTAKTDEAKAAIRSSAEEILASANQEGADFAELAKKHSGCPSASAGGDLGFFPRTGMMVEEFAKAAFDLEVGQVSDIVETQFGYHIIKVTERKEGSTKTLDEVADSIRAILRDQKLVEARNTLVAELREGAEIVNPGS